MALEYLYRNVRAQRRVALFPGSWNPPTVAHMAIARAGLEWAEEVIWVLPRTLPHKAFAGAGFDDRLRMLGAIARATPGYSVAVTEGGLYAEMAAEAVETLGGEVEIDLLCGRDAAERIEAWNYGEAEVFDKLIERHRLLVAARWGQYHPPAKYQGRIVRLSAGEFDEVSSSEVRRRLESGEDWRHLVPAELHGLDFDLWTLLNGGK